MRRSRSGSAATAALTSRKRRMVRFISSIVPASSSTSFTIEATSTGRENSKRRIAFASPTSARIGRAIALAASRASDERGGEHEGGGQRRVARDPPAPR